MIKEIANRPEVKLLLEMMRLSNTEAYIHSLGVANIVEKMLQFTEYSEEDKKEVIAGALLHDIGKVFVPLNLTQCPQSLTPQEFQIIKVHASVSYEIVKPVFSRIVQNICLYHHERPNGTGYMENVVLYNIPTEALLVQVADEYEALTNERSYKRKYSTEEALNIMRDEAIRFMLDDQYVRILEKILENKEQ